MAEITLSSKNQIVVPREAREALNLKPGDKLVVTVHAGKFIIFERPESYRDAIRGMGKGLYPADYLKKEHESWE